MDFKNYVKVLGRSGSLKFTNALANATPNGEIDSVAIDGKPFYYRVGTSDTELAYQILMKGQGEYAMPEQFSPGLILDIGANIGATTRFFLREYPNAQICCFEPVKSNFEVLQKNVAAFPNVRAFNFGLGQKTETIEIFHSDNPNNFGGFSRFQAGSNPQSTTTVLIKSCAEFFAEEKIGKIDLIKIDTEGAEYDILTAMPPERLAEARWIIGELHSQNDFKVLDYLSPNFDIGIKKTIGKRLSMFYGRNWKA